MVLAELFRKEWDTESASTRRMLEAIPADKLAWVPHAKSSPLGRLARHVATLPSFGKGLFGGDSLDFTPGPMPAVSSKDEILALFDENDALLKRLLADATDEALRATWSFSVGGRKLFSDSRAVALQTLFLNHLVHHRGQLGVYLRLLDAKVPGMYGPSADDVAP